MTLTKRKSRFLQLSMLCFMVFSAIPSSGFTNEQDVAAINDLYVALGSPVLPGWIPNGGDPCLENWQGVTCVGSNITGITINSANLGGELGEGLGKFTAINVIDFSNNNIGGSIPESLPPTLNSLFLSANQFTGSIPLSLSKLTLLSAMSLNVNQLSGELPDAFQSLAGLVNLDLSSNNFSGKLPPSMEGLSSLTTMRVQNNRLSGTLDVLQDLPIKDLDIENNLFSGPIPVKLLSIPTFKKDGNPLINSTEIAPSSEPLVAPPELSPPLPFRRVPPPPPHLTPSNSSNSSSSSSSGSSNFAEGPSSQVSHTVKKSGTSTIKIIGFVIIGAISLIVIVLVIIFCVSKFQERKERYQESRQEIIPHVRPKEPKSRENYSRPNANDKRVRNASEDRNQVEINMNGTGVQMQKTEKKKEHVLNRAVSEDFMTQPPPPPPPPPPHPASASPPIIPIPFPVEKVTVKPKPASETSSSTPPPNIQNTLTSVASYSVAQLQQYTNSFAEDNLIRDGRLGKVFLAELPDGKLLTVLKLDNVNSRISVDEFLDLVLSISELQHPNIVELVGYSAEHGQRLLVYNYFSKKTLHDILYYEDDLKKKLSWGARLHVVLGAAKALEYLHEGCQPPIVHQEFEPSNILVNDKFAVRISDCGLAPLLSSNSVTQLSGRMRALFTYEAPEVSESGSYSEKSDVYSFGVVMLELLTSRKPFDSSLPRAEQHLVRWARSQLHDINNLSRMVDPSLGGKCSKKSLSQFADIISRCIQQEPEFRPPMSEVVQDLNVMLEDSRREQTEPSVRTHRKRENKELG